MFYKSYKMCHIIIFVNLLDCLESCTLVGKKEQQQQNKVKNPFSSLEVYWVYGASAPFI